MDIPGGYPAQLFQRGEGRMAVYHATAVLRAGHAPGELRAPMSPRDLIAHSEAEALEAASDFIALCVGEWCEHVEESEAAQFAAEAEMWEAQVRLVNRPSVDVEPRRWTTEQTVNGRVVGKLYHYGEETGEQSFDVLIGGRKAGLLVERRQQLPMAMTDGRVSETRIWRLSEATGVLAQLLGREWQDPRPVRSGSGIVWPDAALAGIRTGLEQVAASSAGT
jgi:hypothetical protein